MKCPKCQHENREGAKFCNDCGYKFEVKCPAGSKSNPSGSKFCDECCHNLTQPSPSLPKELSFDKQLTKIQRYLPQGLTEKILSQKNKIEGERKQVTVMFCDMAGYTSLSEILGPEEAYSIMDQVYEILIRHHGLHRISNRKLSALTAVHNFFIRRRDGSTAAERFFGNKPKAMFEFLLNNIDLPGRPARRRL